MMTYLNHNTERALSAVGVLAAAFWRLTTTMTQAKCAVYCAHDAITSYCQQRRMTQQSYSRQSIISDIHRHEQFWEKETGRTISDEWDGYTVMITGDQLDDLREAAPEPAFKFSNDDGTKLYRTADGLGMTSGSGTKLEWCNILTHAKDYSANIEAMKKERGWK